MTNEERAKQLIEMAYAAVRHSSEDVSMDEILEDGIAQALSEAEARGRRRGLEEAARLAEGATSLERTGGRDRSTEVCLVVAAAIRALADAREDGANG